MDLIELLKEKAQYLYSNEKDCGIESIISHIQIAEKHYQEAKLKDYFFNDVIYRSNQAFEGILKEAYCVLRNKKSCKKSPHKIEKFFEEEKILKKRVLQLFRNYRSEWRNESTHNYKIQFSGDEAFLAIVSISAFINVLFDQMIEKKAYYAESENLKLDPLKITMPKNQNLCEMVVKLIKSFSKQIYKKLKKNDHRNNHMILSGSFQAFVNSLAKGITLTPEFSIKSESGKILHSDLLLKKEKESLILEFKLSKHRIIDGINQLFYYLINANIKQGILYNPPTEKNQKLEIKVIQKTFEDQAYTVTSICSGDTFDY